MILPVKIAGEVPKELLTLLAADRQCDGAKILVTVIMN